jgi:aminopeptidase N
MVYRAVLMLAFAMLISCQTGRKTTVSPPVVEVKKQEKKLPEPEIYHPASTRLHDIQHMELRVSFDWERRYLFGEATLTIKPYWYPQNTLYLNARGMLINEVSLMNKTGRQPLNYEYRNDTLFITLDKTYTRQDTFQVYIDYVSRPDELKDIGGSAAIASDKGLYFINADGSDPKKPRQIWTQGETQSSSVWFPTIDSPNEQFTQELYITVDTSMVTLSNGLLVSSVINAKQGLRTDYWRQTLPHAPYLVMMAIGKYSVVRDKWRNLAVEYYVEPEYAPHAHAIFGNTPEMLEYFSKILGVDYPWEKYAQVVVRDFVSGAMENTTATIHGEFIQTDSRSLLDEDYEDIIAHELFHHWFGNLVTCESWANIPLNESFATYGEYLWNEYKYGRDHADAGLNNDLETYQSQRAARTRKLIRFDYKHRDDVFDVVSYQKGARILHMLRNLVGDEAFFKSLQLYLTRNRHQPVEAHQLRLAFEEITGQDLNWFFNQWFFNSGHPELEINYQWDESLKKQTVIIEQKQDFEKNPLYRLPLDIDLYTAEGKQRYQVEIRKVKETFEFFTGSQPLLVNVDADKYLLCTKKDNRPADQWVELYHRGPLYMDRLEALQKITRNVKAGTREAETLMMAINDKYHGLRVMAIKAIGPLSRDENTRSQVKSLLLERATNDSRAAVRAAALKALYKHYSDDQVLTVLDRAVRDSSYRVIETALTGICELNRQKGISLTTALEDSPNPYLRKIAFRIYASYGHEDKHEFMLAMLPDFTGGERYQAILELTKFLTRCSPLIIETGLPELIHLARHATPWWLRLAGHQALNELSKTCEKQAEENAANPALANQYLSLKNYINNRIQEIKQSETDKNLLRLWGMASSASDEQQE